MISNENDKHDRQLPEGSKASQYTRGLLQLLSGAIPVAGGVLSLAAGAWSDYEQEKINKFLAHWIKMLEDELREKEETILEIIARIDLKNEKVTKRIESPEYQSLLRKTFREWSGAESREKRTYIRNILANAASTQLSSDDVVKLYIDWINKYSELHFKVIAVIYNSNGIGRGEIWEKLNKSCVREDSADADLYKLLFRDLSTGGIIRQHRKKDYNGNFLTKSTSKRRTHLDSGAKKVTSAFEDVEKYELTELGKQFIHYAMTDLPLRIEVKDNQN